ncbi:MAG: ABC transporter substrate-binding protein [Pseudomonadota bacterium]
MTDRENTTLVDGLVSAARARRITRRHFMEGALASGLTVAAANTLWATKVEAATPKPGGTYRVGVHDGNTTDSLDPGTTESVFMIQMNHAIRSYLTEITNENDVGPDAAVSWEASADASEWRFQLAEGMEFHDGKSMTSADVVASLNYHRGEDSKSAAKALLSDVTDIVADGKNGVVIKLSNGNADLPYLLSDYHLVMGSADAEGNVDWVNGPNAGPYKIKNFDAGVGAELEKHANYHRDTYFDAVQMTVVNDPNARQSALVTGEVDAITEADLKTVGLMGRRPNITITEVASGAHCTIPMFVDTAPFDNADVRMALKFGINRQEIVDKILFGHGSIGNDHPIGPTLPFYADLEQREYDPDKAKFHLKQAGLDSLTVSLSAGEAAFSNAVDMAVLFRESAAAAGITVDVVREPSDGYWSNVWLKKPFVVVQWGARPTPDVMFSLAYKDDAAWNESHWKNARFNELLLLAKAELDQAKRAEMYREMQQLCRDDGGTIVPFFRNRVNVYSNNLKHPESMAGNWELDGARSYQRWWFDS